MTDVYWSEIEFHDNVPMVRGLGVSSKHLIVIPPQQFVRIAREKIAQLEKDAREA